jgi:hypothetical protein
MVLSRHSPGGTEEYHENKITGRQDRDLNPRPPDYEAEMLTTYHDVQSHYSIVIYNLYTFICIYVCVCVYMYVYYLIM